MYTAVCICDVCCAHEMLQHICWICNFLPRHAVHLVTFALRVKYNVADLVATHLLFSLYSDDRGALHNRLEGRSHRFEERGNDVPRLMLGRVVARGNDLHLGLAAVRAATRAAARAAALAPRKWAKRSPDQTTAKTSSQLRGDGKSLGPSKAASKRTKLHENAVSASHTSLS